MDSSPAPAPLDGRDPTRDRRKRMALIGSLGVLTAVAVGLLVALGVFRSDPVDETPPPASEGGLQIELAQTDVGPIDPARPLRCFVEGRFAGEMTVARCAERNGVAAQALDVGLDDTGALAAVVGVAAPPVSVSEDPLGGVPAPLPVTEGPPVPATPNEPTGTCSKGGAGGEWQPVGGGVSRRTCLQLLFAGRCTAPGEALYGRWGSQTLRLVQGGVEVSDGAGYRPLASQDPQTCLFP
jgi:hypothetical protein